MIPYGRQTIEADDIEAVVAALQSERLTQGTLVDDFERALADYIGVAHAAVFANGTAALHAAYAAFGIGPGDEVITTPLTFAATTNAALWQGAKPVFVDIGEDGNIDYQAIESHITHKTKIIAPVDYMGRPVAIDQIMELADHHKIKVLEDACHALGAVYHNQPVGSMSDASVFSFHPVKSITTGEGGAVLTNDSKLYQYMKQFGTHGLTKTNFKNPVPGPWYMEMQFLGQNYRLTDIQSALGISQLKKIDRFIAARKQIAETYTAAFKNHPNIIVPFGDSETIRSSWHLYVIRLTGTMATKRAALFTYLQDKGIMPQVHYVPVYHHPYYRALGYVPGLCPRAEAWYDSCISLPLYPTLQPEEQETVIRAVLDFVNA